ncbi:MAG TPA: glutamine-hydrolyzing GMP synthase, partial [Clostridia bacterium]|nr:glutamine-hydrolyzing GMP synthase [Clostridia bacterium]
MTKREMILILDFGGQYSHLIARRIRELKVYCEILPYNTSVEKIKDLHPRGIIFSGGPSSVYRECAPTSSPELYELCTPILGICYGMQLMSEQLGGKVSPGLHGEYGKTSCHITGGENILMAGLEKTEQCWMSHGDLVIAPPPGFETIAFTEKVPVAAMENAGRGLYAVQFHPEVDHTPKGKEILGNFVHKICGCGDSWTMSSFLDESLEEVKAKVGGGRVLCGLSGGVDSSVAAVMVHRAVQDQLTCVFVNHGLLRKGEAEQVMKTFGEQFHMHLVYVDARERFLTKLAGVTDPEEKRKIIGEEFIRVFEEEAAKLGQVDFLVQGTLYSDIVESGTETAAVIKSHHNVGGLPEDMKFELIEPLKWLFKDEV